MKRIAPWSLGLLALAACSDHSPVSPGTDATADLNSVAAARQNGFVNVTNDQDDGKGSFRWAVGQANGNPGIEAIRFRGTSGTIRLASTVTYTGAQPLTIEGNSAVIDGGAAGGPAFAVTGGADLTVEDLTVRDAPAEGIAIQVPGTASGTVKLTLARVLIAGNRGHGVLMNDQVEPETVDDVQPNAAGSAAGLEITIIDTRFRENGYSVSDRDGFRANEGGDGSIVFVSRGTWSEDNAADGIELDERGNGDVRIDVQDTHILRNGKFDPLDFDDGFDIDEYNDGSIVGTVVRSEAVDNYEEGLDFNENNAGDLRVDLDQVVANGNDEEGIDYEEDDDFAGGGDLVTTMTGITANGNKGDGGLKIREKGLGSLTAHVTGVEANSNAVSGIAVREDADGTLTATIANAMTHGNAAHGIDFDENSTGDLVAVVSNAVASGNALYGIRADQQLPGTGTLQLTQVNLAGNTGGMITGSNVVTQ